MPDVHGEFVPVTAAAVDMPSSVSGQLVQDIAAAAGDRVSSVQRRLLAIVSVQVRRRGCLIRKDTVFCVALHYQVPQVSDDTLSPAV